MKPIQYLINDIDSVLSFKFTSYDESKCGWKQIKQDDCDVEQITQNSISTTVETIIKSTAVTSTYSTTTLLATNTPFQNQHETSDIIQTSDQKSCDLIPMNSSWKCSNTSKKHSICVKNCNNGSYERKKCICDRHNCSWVRQNFGCDANTSSGTSENLDESYISDVLRSFIQSLRLINKGEINVNFQLR